MKLKNHRKTILAILAILLIALFLLCLFYTKRLNGTSNIVTSNQLSQMKQAFFEENYQQVVDGLLGKTYQNQQETADGLRLLGQSQYALKQYSEAYSSLSGAVEAAEGKNKSNPLNLLGNLFRDDGDYIKAEEYYLQATTVDPNNSQIWINYATLFENRGDFDKALEIIDSALTHMPNSPELLALKTQIETR